MRTSALLLAAAAACVSPIAFAQGDTCHNCGTVESVQRVTRTETPKGIAGTPVTPGMAIGGVLGGVVGHQVGGGTGRKLATVGGVAGGAYLGHQVEKKRVTAYVMHVRMQDGSMRTIEQGTALAKGSHVIVDGRTAHLRRAPAQG